MVLPLIGKTLYRNLLKEANNLKNETAAAHYRSKIRQDFRRPEAPESSERAIKRLKEANQLLRQLQAANDGYLHSLTRVLEHTYSRRGTGKHALLKPFLTQPTTWRSPTRYTFPPPLSALLLSPKSHTSRPPSPQHLLNPPTLPPRAFPKSEAARLLGPLTLQRVRKIRQRYWLLQTGKIESPMAVRVVRDGKEVEDESAVKEVLQVAGIEDVKWREGKDLLKELEALSISEYAPRLPKRLQTKEERATKGPPPIATRSPTSLRPQYHTNRNTKWHRPKIHSPRLMRRQYQQVLKKAPILVVVEKEGKGLSYRVELSERASGEIGLIGAASAEDEWWESQK